MYRPRWMRHPTERHVGKSYRKGMGIIKIKLKSISRRTFIIRY